MLKLLNTGDIATVRNLFGFNTTMPDAHICVHPEFERHSMQFAQFLSCLVRFFMFFKSIFFQMQCMLLDSVSTNKLKRTVTESTHASLNKRPLWGKSTQRLLNDVAINHAVWANQLGFHVGDFFY
jgi:hypothetical protein